MTVRVCTSKTLQRRPALPAALSHALRSAAGRSPSPVSRAAFSKLHGKFFAHIRDEGNETRTIRFSTEPLLFSPSIEVLGPNGCNSGRPPDQRTLKLGKTVSILHERLPSLLASPLPSEILSPQITLHLFPSTHPHLPNVSGRIAYLAALWTAPVAWGRVPVVGNVKLVILSERMVKNGCSATPSFRNERLIVRWRTCGGTKGRSRDISQHDAAVGGDQVGKITEVLGEDMRDDEEFSGLFIFEFDEEGRIVTHTIEHAQQGGNWEKMTRVVSVTDWLIGLAKNRGQTTEAGLALGYCEVGQREDSRRRMQNERRPETGNA